MNEFDDNNPGRADEPIVSQPVIEPKQNHTSVEYQKETESNQHLYDCLGALTSKTVRWGN